MKSTPRPIGDLLIQALVADNGSPVVPAVEDTVDADEGGNDPTKPYVPDAYEPESWETVECPNCQKMNDEDSAYCGQCGFKMAGATGVKINSDNEDGLDEEDEDGDETEGTAATGVGLTDPNANKNGDTFITVPAEPVAEPVDADGNVANETICARDGEIQCGHLASGHLDTDQGENTGACQMNGCMCPAMVVGNATVNGGGSTTNTDDGGGTGEGDGGGPNNDGGDGTNSTSTAAFEAYPWDDCIQDQLDKGHSQESAEKICGTIKAENNSAAIQAWGEAIPIGTPADQITPPAPAAAPVDPMAALAEPGSNPPPVIDANPIGEPFYGVAIIEGQKTYDGRGIIQDAIDLTTGNGKPLLLLKTETHDPMGFDQNDPAVWCGRIAGAEMQPGNGDTQLIVFWGTIFSSDDGTDALGIINGMGGWAPVSANLIVDEAMETVSGYDEFDWPIYEVLVTKASLAGVTIVPSPAFGADTWLMLGEKPDTIDVSTMPTLPTNAPEGEAPAAPAGVTASAQHPMWMNDFECIPCSGSRGSAILASSAPVVPPRDWFENPNFTEDDGRLVEIFTGRGSKRVGGSYACPLTITADGRVFGHIAPWGVCHTGILSKCETAPMSKANYAHFKRVGQVVLCDDGTMVSVGSLTYDGSHADLHLDSLDTMKHYDNTTTAWAHVNIGEDAFGIWVAGSVLPDVTPENLRRIRGSSPSGDWRMIGGHYELTAVLMVNSPGFPVSLANNAVGSLVAAGAIVMSKLGQVDDKPIDTHSNGALSTALEFAARRFLRSEYNAAKERRKAMRIERARLRLEKSRKRRAK